VVQQRLLQSELGNGREFLAVGQYVRQWIARASAEHDEFHHARAAAIGCGFPASSAPGRPGKSAGANVATRNDATLDPASQDDSGHGDHRPRRKVTTPAPVVAPTPVAKPAPVVTPAPVTTPASPTPTATPTPTAPASTSTSVPAFMSTVAKAAALISKLSKGAKAAPAANMASQLAGAISGTYAVRSKQNNAAGITLNAKGTLPALKQLNLVGKSVGAISSGKATGTLQLVGTKGSVVLKLTAAVPNSGSAIPSTYSYVIASGTGTFKHATGKGSINLTLIAAKKKTPGSFSLVLQPT